MHVEQAVFTSAQTSRMRGYHLVARSAGIDDDLAQQLTRWGPTNGSLLDDDINACSLNYFPLDEGCLAATRSVYGGPEYSNRGELRVVTIMLVLRRPQLAGYANNPLAVMRAAQALGHLRLPRELPPRLASLELPEDTWIGDAPATPLSPSDQSLRDEAVESLRNGVRVAVAGLHKPLAALEALVHLLTPPERLELSFTSGLKPSVRRGFRLHLCGSLEPASRRRLESLGLHCLTPSAAPQRGPSSPLASV
jgi:hypothetical protein